MLQEGISISPEYLYYKFTSIVRIFEQNLREIVLCLQRSINRQKFYGSKSVFGSHEEFFYFATSRTVIFLILCDLPIVQNCPLFKNCNVNNCSEIQGHLT
jgi:hypothetical protein